MPRRNIVTATNKRVERLAKAMTHARMQEPIAMIDNLGWLFTCEPQDADIEETSNLFRHNDAVANGGADVLCIFGRDSANLFGLEGVAKGSADVPCVLGRESANLIGLEGVAKGTADVPCVLARESANLIELEGVANGSADVPRVLGRESANLIGLEGAAKVIRNELDVLYNEMKV